MFHLLVAAILEGHSAGEDFKDVVGVDHRSKTPKGDELHHPFTAASGYEDFVALKEDVKSAYDDYRPCYTMFKLFSLFIVQLEVLLEAFITDGCPEAAEEVAATQNRLKVPDVLIHATLKAARDVIYAEYECGVDVDAEKRERVNFIRENIKAIAANVMKENETAWCELEHPLPS
jgi:hypothetical protein